MISSRIHALVFSVLVLWALEGRAEEVRYRYRLEDQKEPVLCNHMTKVFNQRFKTPWDKGYMPYKPNPTIFGLPYDKVFDRLPGVEYNLTFTWWMLLSRFPTSPEFESVQWKEARIYHSDGAELSKPSPALITQIDIDNDGAKEWVIKGSFMDKMTTDEGWGQAFGGSELLVILPLEKFDPTVKRAFGRLYTGKGSESSRVLDRHFDESFDTMQIRPFVFSGKTYLATYQTRWRRQPPDNATPPYDLYPADEFMNVLQVTGGRRRQYDQPFDTASTELVCRIRMLMSNKTAARKGK